MVRMNQYRATGRRASARSTGNAFFYADKSFCALEKVMLFLTRIWRIWRIRRIRAEGIFNGTRLLMLLLNGDRNLRAREGNAFFNAEKSLALSTGNTFLNADLADLADLADQTD
jgi:hypothetical protein